MTLARAVNLLVASAVYLGVSVRGEGAQAQPLYESLIWAQGHR